MQSGGDVAGTLLVEQRRAIFLVDRTVRRDADHDQLLHLRVVGSTHRRQEGRDQIRLLNGVNQADR